MVLRACGWAAQFVKATLLLTMAVCGGEVGLRVWEMYAPQHAPKPESTFESLLVPSARQYEEFIPRIERTWKGQNDLPVRFRTNSYGGRGEEPRSPKSPGTFRIVWFGNESILAAQVAESLTPPEQLQVALQARSPGAIEVCNAGFPGNCPLLVAMQFSNRWSLAEADLILIHVDERAIARDRLLRRFTHATAEGKPLCCGHPSLQSTSISRATRDWRERWRLIDLTLAWTTHLWHTQTEQQLTEQRLLPSRKATFSDSAAASSDLGTEHCLKPLLVIAELAGRTGAPVVIVTCPALPQEEHNASSRFPVELAAFCRTHRLPLVDATAVWQSHPDSVDLFEKSNGELSIEGLHFYGQVVAETLLANWPGPWRQPPLDESEPRRGIIQPARHEQTPLPH